MRRNLLLAMAAAALSLPAALFSASRVDPVNRDRKGLALQGFDPVAYFSGGGPTAGSARFTFQWMDATWQFASAENRDKFSADPDRYAPQFGGYCAWAVSNNYTAPIDPTAWTIVGGKLYLNYNKRVQEMWAKELDARIKAGEKNWAGLHK